MHIRKFWPKKTLLENTHSARWVLESRDHCVRNVMHRLHVIQRKSCFQCWIHFFSWDAIGRWFSNRSGWIFLKLTENWPRWVSDQLYLAFYSTTSIEQVYALSNGVGADWRSLEAFLRHRWSKPLILADMIKFYDFCLFENHKWKLQWRLWRLILTRISPRIISDSTFFSQYVWFRTEGDKVVLHSQEEERMNGVEVYLIKKEYRNSGNTWMPL